ncbi:MAG TPA: EAL domain-containing protein [Terracidiphilus sp.]|nr:EAL domain-containing protein [Terracidiphilus sp.]
MKERSGTHLTPPASYFADFASSYGEEIDQLLGHLLRLHPRVNDDIRAFADSFYDHLSNQAQGSAILARLSPEELERLKLKQMQHLTQIISPGMTPQDQYKRALLVGWIHEMVGVSLPMLMETYHLYHAQINAILLAADLAPLQRDRLRAAMHQRVQLDVEAQIASHARFDGEIASLLATLDVAIQKARNLADTLRYTFQALGEFEGITACLFSRPDAHGVMQIEAEGGEEGPAYAEAMRTRRIPLFETQVSNQAGNGPAGRAWRSGQIQINSSFQENPSMHAWRDEALQRGFRSSAAVPLLDESGQSFAVLSLYSNWPGFFSAVTREAMLRHIQQSLSQAILRCEQTSVLSADLSRDYRHYLDDGAVEMLYQPIIDLRTGKLDSLEALARLRGADGMLISPAAFLPAFGNAGLLRLFQLGLDQLCRDLRSWRDKDPELGLSVGLNLPPDGLTQDAYRDCVFETLARCELPATVLTLEMLESKESHDVARRDARIEEFQKAGIRIAQDDLGSGHSSLLRMDRVACDRVKIDQGLVRGTLKRPVRALEFIYHLTLLAQGFGAPVTVEGLEDIGLIEAAAILGADYGQGYGISKPMRTQDVMTWSAAWVFPIDAEHPRTALGALAGYLLWDHKLGMLSDWPELAANFIKEPWLVHRYLDRGVNADPELPSMLERTQILALHGKRSPKYAKMRKELIERLGENWLQERQ